MSDAHFRKEHAKRAKLAEHGNQQWQAEQHRPQPEGRFDSIRALGNVRPPAQAIRVQSRRANKDASDEDEIERDLPTPLARQSSGEARPFPISELANPTRVKVEPTFERQGRRAIEPAGHAIGAPDQVRGDECGERRHCNGDRVKEIARDL